MVEVVDVVPHVVLITSMLLEVLSRIQTTILVWVRELARGLMTDATASHQFVDITYISSFLSSSVFLL